MPRPAVLVVDPEASRRRELARGLTSLGYEVIPAVDQRQARSFAAALSPAGGGGPRGLLDRRGAPRGARAGGPAGGAPPPARPGHHPPAPPPPRGRGGRGA